MRYLALAVDYDGTAASNDRLLRSHHYSGWFRQSIKDPHVAEETDRIERRTDITPQQTRDLARALIGARHTLPT